MTATFTVNSSTFSINNNPGFRDQPEIEFAHRLKTREHLTFLQTEKLYDFNDARWAKATVDGEVVYGHEYEDCVFTVRLRTGDGRLTLTDNEDGTLDRHLANTPGETTVYSLTSSNNGIESTHTFSAINAGMASVPILCLCIALTAALATGMSAAAAATAAATAVASIYGIPVTVFPGAGIILAVLALVALWTVFAIEREIMLNLIYENRSTKKTITLVDHYVYNIGDNPLNIPATLKPLRQGQDLRSTATSSSTSTMRASLRGSACR